jgi:hypothetical protein
VSRRVALTNIAAAALLAGADPALSPLDRDVLAAIASWPHIHDLDECIRAGDITLNNLCRTLPGLPRPHVFAAVARLEDAHYLPQGAIR